MTEPTNEPSSERNQIVELQQELARARRELQAAEQLAARPDPWDPKVWVGRARRIGGMGRRFAERTIRRQASPKVVEAAPSAAPSSFESWQRRMQGSRFVGFPSYWRYSRRGPATPAPIAVVLHCHFIDLLDDLVASLAAIGEPFDLYVTNSSGEAIAADRLVVEGARHVEVLTVENHGRDIWPLVQVVNAGILDPYDVVLKVHTKKSAWREEHPELAGDGATWRSSLTSALLGSADNVAEIVAAMRADRDIAAVTADGSVVGTEHWGGDLDLVRGIYRRLSMPLDPESLRFPAGSMYWIRGFVLQGLRAFRFDRDDFEPEAGQIDGTCAHAIERMIGLLSTEAGMRVLERREVPRGATPAEDAGARIVPFYLPQFHRVAENDRWWGTGFTEWYNVVKAEPIYPGHVVPLRPTELGYYSLELDSVRAEQRDLARSHGIEAFMYYYYWFAGHKLLERPIEALLASDLDQPFCIMWANENWTRTWDGGTADVLIAQEYDSVPAEQFIDDVMPLLRDPRYLRAGGAVVLAVYKLAQLPDPAATVRHWRERCRQEGVGELLLLQVDVGEAMGGLERAGAADVVDGSLGFAPHNFPWMLSEVAAAPKDDRFTGNMMSYRGMADAAIEALPRTPAGHHPGMMVTFDNTARRQWNPDVFTGSNPYTFRRWLAACVDAVADRPADERLVFVNAWNEWAESAVLEPTEQFGRSYLLAIRSVNGG
ncbi:hypothetical protein L332_10770 [Agrococcus pavilionensis RW1]|uniref:Rhamnan synthesis protein F n=1 Tax=Agrococcus pavilionensis RW1 TaxID=1330458 RepID=U1LR20_9MICO|nr:glycoside hydrolase family 99-like domain-containing protein [Agrococcus pavilionensis]ERG64924.1 hypothetical protein L332_10770 [Agrococcus pavilionensis RW1]